MLLVEETTESEELVRCKESKAAISVNEDGGKHLDGIKVQIFSAGGNSSVLLDEIKSESKESVGCGEPSEDHAVKMDADTSTYANVTPETEDDGKESDGDESHDDHFPANDLLRFAWQIAQGMVNNVRLFESHSKAGS